MTSDRTNVQPSDQAGTQPLPFFDEYLLNVLKPRVEGLLEGHEEALRKRVFAGVVRAISEQTSVDPERVERLLTQELGLEIDIALTARFASTPEAAPAKTAPASIDDDVIDVAAEPAQTDDDGLHPGVAETKPKQRVVRVSPLAKAVAGSKG